MLVQNICTKVWSANGSRLLIWIYYSIFISDIVSSNVVVSFDRTLGHCTLLGNLTLGFVIPQGIVMTRKIRGRSPRIISVIISWPEGYRNTQCKIPERCTINKALVTPQFSGTRSFPRSLSKSGTRSCLRSFLEIRNTAVPHSRQKERALLFTFL